MEHLMFGEILGILIPNLAHVLLNELLSERFIRRHINNHFRRSVREVAVSAELFTLSLVHIYDIHS